MFCFGLLGLTVASSPLTTTIDSGGVTLMPRGSDQVFSLLTSISWELSIKDDNVWQRMGNLWTGSTWRAAAVRLDWATYCAYSTLADIQVGETMQGCSCHPK
jgi:hypothetical protein